jgi:hypothetical protein
MTLCRVPHFLRFSRSGPLQDRHRRVFDSIQAGESNLHLQHFPVVDFNRVWLRQGRSLKNGSNGCIIFPRCIANFNKLFGRL